MAAHCQYIHTPEAARSQARAVDQAELLRPKNSMPVLKSLATAVLGAAVYDLQRWCDLYSRRQTLSKATLNESWKLALAADEWLQALDREAQKFTFHEIADALDVDSDRLREGIYSRLDTEALERLWSAQPLRG